MQETHILKGGVTIANVAKIALMVEQHMRLHASEHGRGQGKGLRFLDLAVCRVFMVLVAVELQICGQNSKTKEKDQ